MMKLFLLMATSLKAESRICGLPPACVCMDSVHVVQCMGIDKFPVLSKYDRLQCKIVVISGPIASWPSKLSSSVSYPALNRVDVRGTQIACQELQRLRQILSTLTILDDCKNINATTAHIETGTADQDLPSTHPDSVTRTTAPSNGSGSEEGLRTVSTSVRPTNTTVGNPWPGLSDLRQVMSGTYAAWTAINVIGSVLLVFLICLRLRAGPLSRGRRATCGQDITVRPAGIEDVSVEDIGYCRLPTREASMESIELYTADARSSPTPLKRRRSVEKDL